MLKTYIINLERSKDRLDNTLSQLDSSNLDISILKAVDGRTMSSDEVKELCDAQALKEHPTWLTPGAIGCSLSHLNAYQRMLEDDVDYALILEDDNNYPSDLYERCMSWVPHREENEVCLLYYESHGPCEFSSRSLIELNATNSLVYPIKKNGPITTGAYLITKQAAKRLADLILPVRVAADTWHYFIDEGALENLRCYYPLIVHDANFKSSIGYSKSGLRDRLTSAIDKYRVPILSNVLREGRKKLRESRLRFELVDKDDYRFQSK